MESNEASRVFIDTEKGRPVHPSKNEIVFSTEAKYGDIVNLSMKEGASEDFMHSLFIDKTEICRIKSVWKQL